MRTPDGMSENMSKQCRLVDLLEESNLFRRLSKIDLRQPKWRLAGPCAHHLHQQQRKRHQTFELGFFLAAHFAPIHIYNQTTLRTVAFTQSSFYAQAFLHKEVCPQRTFVHRHLYTQMFLHKKDVFTYRFFVQRCFCAHK